MKLGAYLDTSDLAALGDSARRAEALGYESVWTGEAYGDDAVTPLAIAAGATSTIRIGSAVLQMHSRTPALTAMTALTLDRLSGGRFLLGLGLSGPQVVEGWHGMPYRPPLATTREFVAVVRQILAAEGPITFDGEVFQIPYRGPGASGIARPMRAHQAPRPVPIHLAAMGPRNTALAAEVADGLLPMLWHPELSPGRLAALRGKRPLEVSPTVFVAIGDDVARCRDRLRPLIAYYVGGMGPKGRNFYARTVADHGYEEAVAAIADAYTRGDRAEAVRAVPDDLVDALCLVGPVGRVRERLTVWRSGGVDRLIVASSSPRVLEAVADANT